MTIRAKLPSICSLGLLGASSAPRLAEGQRSPVSPAGASRATPPSPPLVPVPSREGGVAMQGLRLFLEGQKVYDMPWEVLGRKLADLTFTNGMDENHVVRRIAVGLNGKSLIEFEVDW